MCQRRNLQFHRRKIIVKGKTHCFHQCEQSRGSSAAPNRSFHRLSSGIRIGPVGGGWRGGTRGPRGSNPGAARPEAYLQMTSSTRGEARITHSGLLSGRDPATAERRSKIRDQSGTGGTGGVGVSNLANQPQLIRDLLLHLRSPIGVSFLLSWKFFFFKEGSVQSC